jgi:hypothetical protein
MTIRKHLATTVVALLTLTFSLGAAADWQAEEGNRLQQRAEKAIEKVRTKVERSHPYFEDAYAMAVWPGITRIAAGFGGAYGKGVVIEAQRHPVHGTGGNRRPDVRRCRDPGL